MKRIVSVLFVVLTFAMNAAVLVVEGKYQNKNIYVQNAFSNNGVGFCAEEIKVNGKITTDETNSSAFEIDLSALQLKFGETVTIEILHKEGCSPKVLNLEDLKPKPTFEVLQMSVSNTGLLKWTSKNESGALPYIIEQFKWNKWIPIGEVDGLGTPEAHDYSFQAPLHSGENKFRVKQKGLNALVKYSQEASVKSLVEKPSYAIPSSNNGIDFSAETAYEVYDAYGNVVKKGFGKQVKIDNLTKGVYYLSFDNTTTEFKR